MNENRPDESAQALVESDKGLLAMDESSGQRNARSSTTAKPLIKKKKIALSLSNFLKKHISSPALRRQDDGKQA
ncbi:MAG: hypothetical protein WAL75_04105 [Terracidiphilus sp.]